MKTVFTTLMMLLALAATAQWVQKGESIIGENINDRSGDQVSLSSDGNTVAIGAKWNDDNGTSAGHARVFEWHGNDWVQKGDDIDGQASGDWFGQDLAISGDAETLIIGAEQPHNSSIPDRPGYVEVYTWDGANWVQKGETLVGENMADRFGYSVSISFDGNTIAVCDLRPQLNQVETRVFQWNGIQWLQKGASLTNIGYEVMLNSDGNTIIVGDPFDYVPSLGGTAGTARVYEWNGADWSQKGENIEAEALGDANGTTVAISSDGNTVAISSTSGGLYNKGFVRTFLWSSGEWAQKGNKIEGLCNYGYTGKSISMSSDGNILAINTPNRNVSNTSICNDARIYEWSGLEWSLIGDIQNWNGGVDDDPWSSALSLSADGHTIAFSHVYFPYTDNYYDANGQVRIFELDGASGINDYNGKNKLLVFPNPSQGIYQVEGTGIASVYNSLGKLAVKETIQGKGQLNLSQQAKGIYFLQFDGEKGFQNQKLIKY